MRRVRAICPRLRSGRVAGLRQVLAILARSSSWSRLISAKDSVPQSIPCKKRQGTVRSRCWPQISAGQRTRGGAGTPAIASIRQNPSHVDRRLGNLKRRWRTRYMRPRAWWA